MKKTFQKPRIKISVVDSESLMAASIGVGGNTGISIGEGEPPATGNAKDNNTGSNDGGVWEE